MLSYMEPPLKEDEVPLLEFNAITSTLPASPAKLEEIRQCTDQDVVRAHLKDVVHHGWPEYSSPVYVILYHVSGSCKGQLGFIRQRVQVWRLGYNVKLQQSSKEIWLELTNVLKVV